MSGKLKLKQFKVFQIMEIPIQKKFIELIQNVNLFIAAFIATARIPPVIQQHR